MAVNAIERLIVNGKDYEILAAADEILDQLGEDAQDLGQDDGARIARQAAEAVRKFTSRLDPINEYHAASRGDSTLRGR